MRRYLALCAALSLLAFAGTAAAGSRGGPPQFPQVASGKWSHAEINVKIKKQWHTLILDHGQITQVTPSSVTLRRFDGTTVTVTLDRRTIVNGPGRALLRRGFFAETMEIDGGAAVRVRVTLRP
ncbi:MAG TPA: hypothetical protein VHC67_05185 [Gaiellaceae bacterium]|jgi:hypothetical protein|nr:hypothetical protein [Gaiellaceae bacterium]